MASTNRTGRVSSIDYGAGTYEVTYFDRGKSVTRKINAQSNGEYKMPAIGQIVSVSHNSNGTAAATTTGTVWNKTNTPAEGYEGLYRKEYSNTKGQAYSRYDANTGVYTQFVDKRTGRNCNGEIYDEAKGAASFVAGGQVQLKSSGANASINAKTGVGIVAGTAISIEAGTTVSIEAKGDMSEAVGGKLTATVDGGVEKTIQGDVKLDINGTTVTIGATGSVSIRSPSQISMEAPIINIRGGSGEVEINGIKLTGHKHTDNLGSDTSAAKA